MRDYRVDFLRCCGVCLIILAHCSPPSLIFQARNFDVPMMVLIAGISFGLSFKEQPYLDYVKNRFKRLLLPVWCFLVVYFSSCLLFAFPVAVPSGSKIVHTFLLNDGIGYVWIIRVFLMVALIAPFIFYIHKNISNNFYYLCLVLIVLLINEILLILLANVLDSGAGKIIEKTIFYVIPYAAVFALGLRFLSLTKWQLISVSILVGSVFVGYSFWLTLTHGEFIPTQKYKYPPQLYYFSYAIVMSILLWSVAYRLLGLVRALNLSDVVAFIGQNSIWIYLWHIPFVIAVSAPFYVKYPLILGISVLITFAQVSFLKRLLLPRIAKPSVRKNVAALFTG